MNAYQLQLLTKIKNAQTLDAAKAYADAIEILNAEQLVSVKLSGFEQGKIISVIKELREIYRYGLKEAKDIVEQGYTWKELSQQNAAKFVERMRGAGAVIAIV